MTHPTRYALIVAGGKGLRMGQPLPKQFLPLAGTPVLMHTLRQFAACDPAITLYLVLPAGQQAYWNELCEIHAFDVPHTCIAGGPTRTESVRNGLAAIPGEAGYVAVHDGVRPFVPTTLIEAAYQRAAEKGNAVAAVPLKDSLRQVRTTGESLALDRSAYRLVQTPQTFSLALLKAAYRAVPFADPSFTDDASVVERFGHTIQLVEGSYHNIKITTSEDMLFAEAYLSHSV